MSAAEAAVATERATPARSSRFICCPLKLNIRITPCGLDSEPITPACDASFVEAGANAPPKSRLQATLRGCDNDRLRVNHTFRMPAKVGPKRVRALARAGCYFDSSAARCGVRCVRDLRESGDCVHASEIVDGRVPACARARNIVRGARIARVSKDEWHQRGRMVRDGAARLLAMRV
jgi:hypothetical protein